MIENSLESSSESFEDGVAYQARLREQDRRERVPIGLREERIARSLEGVDSNVQPGNYYLSRSELFKILRDDVRSKDYINLLEDIDSKIQLRKLIWGEGEYDHNSKMNQQRIDFKSLLRLNQRNNHIQNPEELEPLINGVESSLDDFYTFAALKKLRELHMSTPRVINSLEEEDKRTCISKFCENVAQRCAIMRTNLRRLIG